MKAKKKYGQNFLINPVIIAQILDSIPAKKDDLIIEIGPGMGALTKCLKETNSTVLAYEIDNDMHKYLDCLEDSKLRIVYKDILSANISEDIKDINYHNLYIVGNLPYYITTPIIEHIVKQDLDYSSLTIMVQKEVAERFMAKPKQKEYGYFTLFLKYYFDVEKICDVSKTSFNPPPKVESAVIKLIPRKDKPTLNIDCYFTFLKKVFSQKRKTLKNNLGCDFQKVINIMQKYNLSEMVRAEELDEGILIEMINVLF